MLGKLVAISLCGIATLAHAAPPLIIVPVQAGQASLNDTALWRSVRGKLHTPHRLVDRASLTYAAARIALGQIQSSYAKSDFQGCLSLAATHHDRLATALRRQPDTALLKQLLQWQGLCAFASADIEAAKRAFGRAKPLRGPEPQAALFPPRAMKLYGHRLKPSDCRPPFRVAGATVTRVNGRKPSATTQINADGAYAEWSAAGRAHSDWVALEASCTLKPRSTHAQPTGVAAIAAEKATPEFHQALIGYLGGSVAITTVSASQVGVALFRDGRKISASTASIRADQSLAEAIAVQIARTVGVSTGGPTKTTPVVTTPIYKRWWFWAIVVGVAGAAVAIPVVATQQDTITSYDVIVPGP